MIETHPFSINPLTGAVSMFHYDHADDVAHIETKRDLQPHIDVTKALYNDLGSDWKGDQHWVASIPPEILPQLEKIGAMTRAGRIIDEKKLKAWLNNADNRAFRVKPGRV